MSPESLDLAHAWLTKARSDLAAARILINGQEKHFGIGSYHCQQAAEKALKGWLTAKELLFPRTHSLEEILVLCIPTDSAFAQFRPHCERLTPLAHEFRYPGDPLDPGARQAAHALALSEEVCAFCEERMAGLQP